MNADEARAMTEKAKKYEIQGYIDTVSTRIKAISEHGGYEIISLFGSFVAGDNGNLPSVDDQMYSFFIAKFPCEIIHVKVIHTSGSGSINLKINNSDSVLDSSITLSSSAGTVKSFKGTDLTVNRQMVEDDYLTVSGTPSTQTQKINITVYFKNLGRGNYRV